MAPQHAAGVAPEDGWDRSCFTKTELGLALQTRAATKRGGEGALSQKKGQRPERTQGC